MKNLITFLVISMLLIAITSLAKDIPKKMIILELLSGDTSGSPSVPYNVIHYADGSPMIGADGNFIKEYTP